MPSPSRIASTMTARLSQNFEGFVVFGDSGTGKFLTALQAALPGVVAIGKGVGGHNTAQIAEQITLSPLHRSHFPLIFDLSGDTAANTQANYPTIVGLNRRPDGKYMIACPLITGDEGTGVTGYYIGGPSRYLYTVPTEWIKTTYPNNSSDSLPALQERNDGTAGDLLDVTNGIQPRSGREFLDPDYDGLHQSDVGARKTVDQCLFDIWANGHWLDWMGTYGTEAITDPDFDNPGSWAAATGWTVTGGTAVFSGASDSNISETSVLVSDDDCFVEVVVDAISGGTLNVRIGDGSSNDLQITEAGTYRFREIADGTSVILRMAAGGQAVTATVSRFSCRVI